MISHCDCKKVEGSAVGHGFRLSHPTCHCQVKILNNFVKKTFDECEENGFEAKLENVIDLPFCTLFEQLSMRLCVNGY